MKINRKVISLRCYILILACFTVSVYAAPTTLGYFQPGPNKFWPFTNPAWAGTGTVIQQDSPFTNPDVFCDMQKSGFRTASIGEVYGFYRNYGIFRNSATYSPGHWSTYYNNDVTQPRLPKMATILGRQVGSLISEWGGDINQYANGWDKPNYWLAEPNTTANRQVFVVNKDATNLAASTANIGVMCVTDMVPIPFLDQSHVDES